MANSDLFDDQFAREIQSMAIYLSTKASKTALTIREFIDTRALAGASFEEIEAQLLDDLLNGGRMFGEFRRAIKSTVRGSVNRVRDIGYTSEFEVDRKYRWTAVLVKTCSVPGTLEGCIQRHGLVKTWDEWEGIGLPRTGTTVCRENCHCVLIPSEFTELQPIKREAK